MAVILTVNYLLVWDGIYLYIHIYKQIHVYIYIYIYLYICIYIPICQFKFIVWNAALLLYSPSLMYAIFTFRKICYKSFFPQVWIGYTEVKCIIKVTVYMCVCVCVCVCVCAWVCKRFEFKFKLQHGESGPAAAWQPRRLCVRLAALFPPISSHCTFSRKR